MRHAILRSSIIFATLLMPLPLPAATVVTIDNGGVGRNASIAIGTDGLPIIAYQNGSDGNLVVAKCTAPGCETAILETVEDSNGDPARGFDISLAVRGSGSPVMAWYDDLNENLAYARCPNADCSGADVLRTLDDSPEDVGHNVSMLLDAGGRVHVAYADSSAGALKFARCPALACTNPTIEVIDVLPSNHVIGDLAMTFGQDGFPAIAYMNWTTGDLLVARCRNVECSGNATIRLVDSGLGQVFGPGPDIVIGADDLPLLSYYDGNSNALKVAKCVDIECLLPASTRVMDNGPNGDSGHHSAIAIRPDGKPVIAYQRFATGGQGGGALRVIECTTPDCTGPYRIVIVDARAGEQTGWDPDIVIGADGGVLIAYHDIQDASLKVAKCNAQTCAGPGDRLFRDGFE